MKKYFIRTTFVLIIGIVMLVIGLANNGMKTLITADGTTQILKEKNINKEYPIKEFKNLKLDMRDEGYTTNVEFVYGDKYSVKLVARNLPGTENMDLSVKNSGDTLNISSNRKFKDYGIIGLNSDDVVESDENIIITIPEFKKIDNASMMFGDGTLKINNNMIKKIDISGAVNMELADVDFADGSYINGEGGSINIRNSIIRGAIKINPSDINISNSQIKNMKLDAVDSSVTLDNVKLDNTSIVSDDEDLEMHQLQAINKNSILIKDGDINITNIDDFGLNVTNNDDDDITVNGKNYQNSYKKDEKNKNILNITTSDGDVSIN